MKLFGFNTFLSFTDPQKAVTGNGFTTAAIARNLLLEFRSLDSAAPPFLILTDLPNGMAAGQQVRFRSSNRLVSINHLDCGGRFGKRDSGFKTDAAHLDFGRDN